MSAGSDDEWRPAVTAVVPTRDRPDMLRRAVQAILGQDYPGHVECVVVFDQCEPSRPDVDVATNRSLRVVGNARKPGLAGARNSGVVAASGELVASCDDDDEWLPGKLSAQVALLRAQPDVSCVATGILVHYRGRDMARAGSPTPLDISDLVRDRHMELHPSTFLSRRSDFLGRIGVVDENIPGGYAEDYDWLLRAARTGPVVSVVEPLVRVYWHDSSFFVSRWQTTLDSLQYLLDRHPEFQDDPRGLARVRAQMALAHAALGHRSRAVREALQALRSSRRARQAYAAIVVSCGVSVDRVVALARRFGRGM